VGLFAILGIESIYRNPTPFHAMLFPASDSWTGAVLALGLIGVVVFVFSRIAAPDELMTPHRIALFAGMAFLWVALLAGVLSQDVALRSGKSSMWDVLWEGARWHLPAVMVATAFAAVGHRWYRKHPVLDESVALPSARRVVLAIIAFSILFSASIAMIRGGPEGIAHAYHRESYEYIGDIGIRTNIRIFLRDYNALHDYLSMHAKVHPPGPVVMLWMMSSVLLTRSPMLLSLATIVAGSTAVIPLYLWVRDMLGRRVALFSSVAYALMPSIVLFTATSADILFMPLTLWALFLFWRAIHRNSWIYAVGAGVVYGLMSLSSFSLITVGAFFGFVGLWRLGDPKLRFAVLRTAALMLAAFLAVHLAVRYWSGFDIVECFRLSKAQFDEDQANVDIYSPRYPAWTFRFLNPMTMFFFAGIPVSVLFCWRLFRPEVNANLSAGPPASRAATGDFTEEIRQGTPTKGLFIVFAMTLFVLNLLYLARGEGERSAMYVLPFMVIPAAHLLHECCVRSRSVGPAAVTFAFLAIQSWAIETCLYTYW
jgi:hypothetical protein